jgi:hypothetical protein
VYLGEFQAQLIAHRARQEETQKKLFALMPHVLVRVFKGELL